MALHRSRKFDLYKEFNRSEMITDESIQIADIKYTMLYFYFKDIYGGIYELEIDNS